MQHKVPKLFLLGGAVGGPLFVIIFLIEGFTRPGYNPLRLPISSLSIGDSGWIQVANFLVTGFLFFLFAIAFWNRFRHRYGFWPPLLIGVAALGLFSAGIFSSDPLFGYPEGNPFTTKQHTTHGHLHNIVSFFVFLCLPAACLVMRKRFNVLQQPGWARYSHVSAVGMFAMFVLAGVGFEQLWGLEKIAGVFQRLSVIIGWGWLAALSLRLYRENEES